MDGWIFSSAEDVQRPPVLRHRLLSWGSMRRPREQVGKGGVVNDGSLSTEVLRVATQGYGGSIIEREEMV